MEAQAATSLGTSEESLLQFKVAALAKFADRGLSFEEMLFRVRQERQKLAADVTEQEKRASVASWLLYLGGGLAATTAAATVLPAAGAGYALAKVNGRPLQTKEELAYRGKQQAYDAASSYMESRDRLHQKKRERPAGRPLL